LGIHKWEQDIYIGFSPALHLQCVRLHTLADTLAFVRKFTVVIFICFWKLNTGYSIRPERVQNEGQRKRQPQAKIQENHFEK